MVAGTPTSWMRCGGGSSPRASSAPATVAEGAKSPPIASSAMRAKVTLPALRLAAHPHSSRTLRKLGVGAWRCCTADRPGWRSPGRPCACCARASGAWRCVASGQPWEDTREKVIARRSGSAYERSASQRGSVGGTHSHAPSFKSAPQDGQSPLQSSRHSTSGGTARSHSSRTAGLRSSSRSRGLMT